MSLFSNRLYTLRKENNLSQEELANNLNKKYGMNTNKGTISKYESGQQIPGFTFIDILADYFGVTTDYLMGRSDNKYYSDNVGMHKIPVLKTISIGKPLADQDNIIGFECINDNCDFCLKVNDDSMIGARIFKNDIVFVNKQRDIESGDIAVIAIDDEIMIRRVLKINGTIIFHPENPAYKDVIIQKKDFKQVNIIGKVRFVKAEVK